MDISVIVPTYQEESRVLRVLGAIRAMNVHEILVVDGGSSDHTVPLAKAVPGVTVLAGSKGRARQLNLGASHATGDVLWFVHADVTPPSHAPQRIHSVLADPGVVAGAFRTHTVCDQAQTWVTPLLPVADFRARYTTRPYGDQAIFVRARVFSEIGGFADLPIFEDLDLNDRLRRVGRLVVDETQVQVSGRRFLASPFYSTLVMNTFPTLYRLGVPLMWLSWAYGDPR